jgi:EpsI family protein
VAAQGREGGDRVTKLAVAIAFLALNYYTYHYLARQAVIPPRTSFETFPLSVGEWKCDGKQFMTDDILKNLGATDYVICDYKRAGHGVVSLYVGYHATQIREEGGGSGENSIHPPAHCLPGSGWDIIDSRNVRLDIPGLPRKGGAEVKRLVIARGEDRQLVYYWYQSQGRVIAEDWQKILYVGYDRATRGRTDGSLVRFTVPIRRNDDGHADRAFEDLARQIVPLLHSYVPD